jgi:hypothetical protein
MKSEPLLFYCMLAILKLLRAVRVVEGNRPSNTCTLSNRAYHPFTLDVIFTCKVTSLNSPITHSLLVLEGTVSPE